MYNRSKFSVLSLIGLSLCAYGNSKPVSDIEVKEYSYVLGRDFAVQAKTDRFPIDITALQLGLSRGTRGDVSLLSKGEKEASFDQVGQQIEDERNKESEARLRLGHAFLKENESKSGVKTLPSGLQVEVHKKSNGPLPNESDLYEINYQASNINGDPIDFSGGIPHPLKINLRLCPIPGLKEGLMNMPEGSTYTFTIPAELGFGSSGYKSIPPNETLIIRVEALQIIRR
ncbi:MAG: FKBP-type peptidyl-prolyl cis-trans isomerase N-terminal domain-containing protein [Verrucomicrobiota bacterium]